jgi:hypothetical protein
MVPDIHNCPVSAGAQSAKMLHVPHVSVSALLSGARVTFLQTVCQQTLDTCSCSEALQEGCGHLLIGIQRISNFVLLIITFCLIELLTG